VSDPIEQKLEHADLLLRLDLAEILDSAFGRGDDRVFSGDPVIAKIIERYKKYELSVASAVMQAMLEEDGEDGGS